MKPNRISEVYETGVYLEITTLGSKNHLHGFHISIGLTGTHFHFNGQIDAQFGHGVGDFQPPRAGQCAGCPGSGHWSYRPVQAVGNSTHGLGVEHIADCRGHLNLNGPVFNLKFYCTIPQTTHNTPNYFSVLYHNYDL